MREKQAPEDVEGRYLAAGERFESVYFWGHDFTLDFSSPHLKALEWVTLADEVCALSFLGGKKGYLGFV